MIINSTGNNFGVEQIEFKAALDNNYIILNGKFSFDRDSEEYASADVLEIYVPDLPMKRSLETAVYMLFDTTYYGRNGTVVKSWIKNKNTICVEKLSVSDSFTNFEFMFYCAYLPKGQRDTFEIEGQIELTLENFNKSLYEEIACAVVREKWAMIAVVVGGLGNVEADESFSFDLTGFPTEIASDVPFFGHWNSASGYGSFYVPGRIENGKFMAGPFTEKQADYPSSGLFKVFIALD